MGTYVEVDMYGLPADTRQEETENDKIKEKEEMKVE